MNTNISEGSADNKIRSWRHLPSIITKHIWFKCFGTTIFMTVFFVAYIFLLKHPAYPVTIVPRTELDRLIGFEPLALPFYVSLWIYVSLPPMLMLTRKAITEYGAWIGALCLTGLTIFYFWPTAVPPSHIDWARYPGMVFLKGVDANGNACPSLHVATAVFSWFYLKKRLPELGLSRAVNYANTIWCLGILYSTMAIRQHMAIDVYAGMGLALIFALAYEKVTNIDRPKQKKIDLPQPLTGKTFVLTGTLNSMTRDTVKNKLESLGAKVSVSISKNTNHVVIGDDADTSLCKAPPAGVTILNEAELLLLLDSID